MMNKTPLNKTPLNIRTPASVRLTPTLNKFTPSKPRLFSRKSQINVLKAVTLFIVAGVIYISRPKFSGYANENDDIFLIEKPLYREFGINSDNNNADTNDDVKEHHHRQQHMVIDDAAIGNLHTQGQGRLDLEQEYQSDSSTTTTPTLDAALHQLGQCEDFSCIKTAHQAIGGRTRFNFPHFFLIGWQKCATTSINLNLRFHPEYLPSPVKESHYFTTCQNYWNHPSCMAHNTSQYIRDFFRRDDAVASRLEKASADASVDYAWKGAAIAPELQTLFPWIKLVVVMREPISRLISYVRMFTELGHQVKGCLNGRSMYDCLQYHFDPKEANSNYSVPLETWFDYFPASQFHVIQFEELQADPNGVVARLKVFLGMDPAFPKKEMKNTNPRKQGGYAMKREDYEQLVKQARWDGERVASMLAERGLADWGEWMGRWERVWKENLETCGEDGVCYVNSN